MSLAKAVDGAATVFAPSGERSLASVDVRERPLPRPKVDRSSDRLPRVVRLVALPASLAVAYGAGIALVAGLGPNQHRLGADVIALLFAVVGAAYMLVEAPKRNTRRFVRSFGWNLKQTAAAVAIGTVASLLIAPFVVPNSQASEVAGQMFLAALPALVLVPIGLLWAGRAGGGLVERVLILGSGQVAEAVSRRLSLHRGMTVVGTVDDVPSESTVGGLSELDELCRRHGVSRIVVAFSRKASHETVEFLRGLDPAVSISVVPRMFELTNWSSELEEFDGMPMLHLPRPRVTRQARAVKRTMDIIASGLALVLFSPLLIGIACAIRLDSRGPVFFRQARTGRGGRTFRIFKFRTMRKGAEEERDRLAALSEVDGPIFKIREDPRVTRVGRFLRKTSLDELPQLLNVIKGDMSLVGPRPFPVSEAAQITGWSVSRTDVRPGITGLWQVSGRNDLSFDDLRYLDSLYVASWSIWWDLRILLQTPARVFRRAGAY